MHSRLVEHVLGPHANRAIRWHHPRVFKDPTMRFHPKQAAVHEQIVLRRLVCLSA
jgi:hypothetical protein